MTQIMIRNVEAQTKEGDAPPADITVKQTGGGPPRTEVLSPGEEALFDIGEGKKIQVSEGSDE